MKIYLAGPMSNVPEFNFPAFHEAAAKLRSLGHEVFNPAEADIERSGGIDPSKITPDGNPNGESSKLPGLSRRECLADDTQWICKHAEAIAMLPGWPTSSGAMAEYTLALALELPVIFL